MQSYSVHVVQTSISHTKDGGLRLGFATQELNEEEKLVIIKQFQSFGKLTYEPDTKNIGD